MSHSNTPVHEILTLEEVARYLRLKPQTLYKWAQERRIPAVKLGKEWRFRKSVLDRWLDDQMLSEESGLSHLREIESGKSAEEDPESGPASGGSGTTEPRAALDALEGESASLRRGRGVSFGSL